MTQGQNGAQQEEGRAAVGPHTAVIQAAGAAVHKLQLLQLEHDQCPGAAIMHALAVSSTVTATTSALAMHGCLGCLVVQQCCSSLVWLPCVY